MQGRVPVRKRMCRPAGLLAVNVPWRPMLQHALAQTPDRLLLLEQGDELIGIAGGSPRAGQPALPERFENSPRGRLAGLRGSLSPRQGSQPRTTPTGRAAPDSQV